MKSIFFFIQAGQSSARGTLLVVMGMYFAGGVSVFTITGKLEAWNKMSQ